MRKAALRWPSMASPLFDPSKMNAAKRAADGPMTVSQAAAALDGAIRRGFSAPVRVVGEVGGFTDRTHWYFDIKDDAAVLGCVAFQSVAKRCGVVVRSGMRVVVTGRFELYAKTGRVSLIVESVEAAGQGSLAERLKVLVDELRGLGWLDPARKRPLPRFPRRVAVITSRTGAALQDVLVTMNRRCPAVGVLVVDVRVQGESAAAEATAAVRELSRRAAELRIDAVILTRGGGSMEDLWSFNDRGLAKAIVECSVPVVAAIGHETDTTVAELVADERAATPTLAATRLTPDGVALGRELDSHESRLTFAVRGLIDSQRAELASIVRRPVMTDPARMVRMRDERLAAAAKRGTFALAAMIRSFRAKMQSGAARLDRVRPAAALARQAERLRDLERRMSLKYTLEGHRRRLLDLETAAKGGIRIRLAGCAPALDALERRLGRGLNSDLERRRVKVVGASQRLRAVSPVSVLDRGYSITTAGDAANIGVTYRSTAFGAAEIAQVRERLLEGIDSLASRV